jgi:hypothetical protein
VESNGGSLWGGAERGLYTVPARRSAGSAVPSSVLTVLDLDELNVTLKNVEMFGSVLSGEGGSANGWRCC